MQVFCQGIICFSTKQKQRHYMCGTVSFSIFYVYLNKFSYILNVRWLHKKIIIINNYIFVSKISNLRDCCKHEAVFLWLENYYCFLFICYGFLWAKLLSPIYKWTDDKRAIFFGESLIIMESRSISFISFNYHTIW